MSTIFYIVFPFVGDGGSGAGPLGNIFPMDYELRFLFTVEDGTNVTYDIDFGDGTSGSTQDGFLQHKYSSIGDCTAIIVIKNSVSVQQVSVDFNLEAVRKEVLLLDNGDPLVFGNPMPFSLSIGVIGTRMCCYVTLDNETRITFRPESTPACTLRPGFSTDVRSFSGKVVNFTHIYYIDGEYLVSAVCASDSSLLESITRTVIVKKPCFFPISKVIEVGHNLTTARKIIKSIDVNLPNANKINCEAALYR